MRASRPDRARHKVTVALPVGREKRQAPRAAVICRSGIPGSIGFALTLLMLVGILPAAEVSAAPPGALSPQATSVERFDHLLDRDGNGVEDLLDRWLTGAATWTDLRDAAVAAPAVRDAAKAAGPSEAAAFPGDIRPEAAVWQQGRLRLLCLGADAGQLAPARAAAAAGGRCRVVHSIDRFGGVTVLDVDAGGLRAFLATRPGARIMLDRDGVPALKDSRPLVGADLAVAGPWGLGDDWSATVAILDSGCDTAHGDLGDFSDDDRDGPAPFVGDSGDWYSADAGWPLFEGYKVVGWHDVTDDFPLAAGPWDYHYHGTALASVVAGSGTVDADYRGVAPGARLTVVKYYDFDETWHAWAGDFLAACAWTLDNREKYRIKTVLSAVNWPLDAGISAAMEAFVAAGITPITAVGNHGTELAGPGFPASVPDVLAVGAVNAAGAVAAYSGRGGPAWGKPDLLGPGGGLLPAGGRIVAADNDPNDSYSERYGTSLAAAHVAGAVHLMNEALQENGVVLPDDRTAVLTRQAVLKLTSSLVERAETPAGTADVALPEQAGHDPERGWGLLRIDAAVEALVHPLMPGRDQRDTLLAGWQAPGVARRLIITPGVRYLVEAVPSAGLDVTLEICDPRWLDDDPRGGRVIRRDANGPGVSEFTYITAEADSWMFLVVKRRTGLGTVNLRIREADTFTAQGGAAVLPGLVTGAPSFGRFPEFAGPTLVIPSRVTVDLVARSLNLMTAAGEFQPGWPVFVFPQSSSQGGLTQPLVWDMDGLPGDEIVVASDYGSVYFFAGDGSFTTVDLVLNRALTAPVGIRSGGKNLAAVVDKLGGVRAWSHGPVLETSTELGHSLPRRPAVGRFGPGDDESLVVAFADGHLTVLDGALAPLPGWPREIGAAVGDDPVLCDLDDDGFHEIIVPVLDQALGRLAMRVFRADGQPGPGDNQILPAPGGGSWLAHAGAVVAGGYASDDLRVVVTGIGDNGLSGDMAAWSLGHGSLQAAGGVSGLTLAGLDIRATTTQGNLVPDVIQLPNPVAWNFLDGGGTEVSTLLSLQWNEILYGVTSLPGSLTAWFGVTVDGRPLTGRHGLSGGGKTEPGFTSSGCMLVPGDDGSFLRVEILDRNLGILPVAARKSSSAFWLVARGDTRNTGAYPVRPVVSAAPADIVVPGGLEVYPNPGSGRFNFRIAGLEDAGDVTLEVFDLRGRRVAELSGRTGAALVTWDGTGRGGRPLAAGTYLAVARSGGRQWVTRVALTR